ncbi:MAG: class I SAM-dependent methyltransferase [Proteobacteria bacterium]|nr:class I SAM-dependent methyltransferase [Pseudomonadota bacterium]
MEIFVPALKILGIILVVIFLYFFTVTRFAVAVKSFFREPDKEADSLYWLYTNKYLIWLTDNQFVVTVVLLFQYDRLVAKVIEKITPSRSGGRVLQISCAYGNFSEKLAEKCRHIEAGEMVVCDIVGNQLENLKKKLKGCPGKITFAEEDAAKMRFDDNSFDSVVVFFLLHELPYQVKRKALQEAMRVVRPGGKVILAEFHKPTSWIMRLISRAYFSFFEPFALDMWGRFNPSALITSDEKNSWTIEQESFFHDNFQVVSATKGGG